ncbi:MULTISPECIES: DEAD/DEAH box helicase [Nostocales]|nr:MULTISPECIES: AAA domain-containing protein [Nostocales]
MLDKHKIDQLLNAWLDFFYLENLSHAEVDAADDDNQIFDKGISLVGDNLLIEESLFKQLKQQFLALKKKGKNNDFQMAVALPQIWRAIEGSRRFYPLFKIDISSIFQGNYRAKGWDLTSFEFQPVPPNLMELYQLDEEEIEALVIKEGLKVFLETTFKQSFTNLQDFIDLVDLPVKPYTTKRAPYLLHFDFVAYNYNLKKDLQKILEQPQWEWADDGHPACEYLFGQPQPQHHEILFLGAFPTHPPTDSQAVALKHTATPILDSGGQPSPSKTQARTSKNVVGNRGSTKQGCPPESTERPSQENPITAVIGPPGNGKTTLLLHKIAQQVVKRAVQLAQTGQDESNLTLVTSTNNRAVSNVEQRLAQDFPTDRFYLSGGSKELITKLVIPKLQAAIDWLQKETFNETECQEVSEKLLAGVNQLHSQLEFDQRQLQQRAEDEQLLRELVENIEALSVEIETPQIKQQLQQQLPYSEPDYSQFPLEAYQIIKPHLDNAKRSLPHVDRSQFNRKNGNWWVRLRHWLTRFWQKLTRTTEAHILRKLHKQISAPILATLATPFPFQIPLTRESLSAACSSVALQLEAAHQWHAKFQKLADTQTHLDSLQRRQDDLVAEKQQVEKRLAGYPTQDFYTRFYTEHHPLSVQLFEWSWQYLQLQALQRKHEVIASLKTYISVLSGEWEAYRSFGRDWRNIYSDLSLLFPVITSTLHSVRNLLPYPDSGCIDQLIVDEAGMIPVHQLFPALVRCKKALVVGDPLQLEPVISFSKQTLEQYCTQAFFKRGLSESDYDRYSPTACDTATAYHRAAGASGQSGDLGNGIILKEHHRCVPPIITFSDRLCNYGLIIKTPDKASALGSNLIAYHVEGKYESHTNPEETRAVEAIIEELLKYGYCIDSPDSEKTIGVISPYRRQANALGSRLCSRWKDFSNNSIGTIHTFQGGEKSVILLSTRQCRKEDSLWFINRRPNLLNVAVSRARELFILVGNLEHLEQGGGHTKMLVEHIRQHGEIRSFP